MKEVAVVILNWNGKHWLEQFLPGVIAHSQHLADIVLVDNCSTDDSVDYVKHQFPTVQHVVLDKNHGFTGGYNRGLQDLKHPFFVLLNSDVEVTPGWLESPLAWFQTDPNLAACQPRIVDYKQRHTFEYAGAAGGYMDEDGYAFCAGRMFFQCENDLGQYQGRQPVFWATGAALFIRSSCWFEANGFDETFFAHMEEIDLCWRLKNRGYRIGADLNSVVYHVGGGTLDRLNPKKTYLNFRNNLLLLVKNYNQSNLFFKIIKRLFLDGLAGIRFGTEWKWEHLWAVVRAHFSFYVMLPTYLKKRRLEKASFKGFNAEGLYQGSVVLAFFMRNQKSFHQLDRSLFVRENEQ